MKYVNFQPAELFCLILLFHSAHVPHRFQLGLFLRFLFVWNRGSLRTVSSENCGDVLVRVFDSDLGELFRSLLWHGSPLGDIELFTLSLPNLTQQCNGCEDKMVEGRCWKPLWSLLGRKVIYADLNMIYADLNFKAYHVNLSI